MDQPPLSPPPLNRHLSTLAADQRGSMIVEAAVALPLMIVMLLGAITYGTWFMAAHSLQQAANDAARSALVALDDDERSEVVAHSVAEGVLSAGTLAPADVEIETSTTGNFYVVQLTYDASAHLFLSNPLIPLPSATIVRRASIQLSSI
ncbi:MAG: TadE/TadG family type IV pilus assembly protein [Alteraurantiacibacter sp.]